MAFLSQLGDWATADEIAKALPGFYAGSRASYRRQLTEDFAELNDRPIPGGRLLVSERRRGYRIASREEFDDYYAKRRKSLMKSLARLEAMKRSANRDGQLYDGGEVEADPFGKGGSGGEDKDPQGERLHDPGEHDIP